MNKQELKANSELLNEDKLYIKRARIVLPYLVRQAKAEKKIYYSDLAEEVGIPNPRNLDKVLGAIGKTLITISKKSVIEIPPIQCLVVNKNTDMPGEGFGWFITEVDFSKLNKTQKQNVVDRHLAKIYAFQKWDWVLNEIGLDPINNDLSEEMKKAKSKKGRKGGESIHHKKFKEYISNNPHVLGLKKRIPKGEIEYSLPSQDTVDVLFFDKELYIGIEVKSIISDVSDILRGIFQCVKYKYLIEAEQIVKGKIPNSRVILALQGQFPIKLLPVKNTLGIEVKDNIDIV